MCIGNNRWATPDVSQCRTIELTALQAQVQRLFDISRIKEVINCTVCLFRLMDPQRLINITTMLRNLTNTARPLLQNDIPTIVNILDAVLKYVYVAYIHVIVVRDLPDM